jgi:hypothetical protein
VDEKGIKQRRVTLTVFVGLALIVVSVLLFAISAVAFLGIGKVMAVVLFPLGLVMVVAGMAMGWGEAFGDPSKKPIQRASGVYVVAKVVADKRANPVIDPEFHDPADLRYLVQVEFANRSKAEFECAGEVFNGIGEGMNGDIVYQGRWLNQFTFVPRKGDRDIGEDPFRSGRL